MNYITPNKPIYNSELPSWSAGQQMIQNQNTGVWYRITPSVNLIKQNATNVPQAWDQSQRDELDIQNFVNNLIGESGEKTQGYYVSNGDGTYSLYKIGSKYEPDPYYMPKIKTPIQGLKTDQISLEKYQPRLIDTSTTSTTNAVPKLVKKPGVDQMEYGDQEQIKSRYADFTLADADELFASAKPRYSEVRFIEPENSYSGYNTVKETFEFRPSNFPMINLQIVDPNVSFSNATKVQFKNGFLSPFNNKSYSYAIGNNKNIFTKLDIYDPETKKTTSYNISPDNPLYKRFKFSEQDPGNWLDAETYYGIVKNLNTPGYFGSVYAPGRQISDKASYVSKAGYPVYDIFNKRSEIDPDSDFTKNSVTYKKPESEKSWYEIIYPKFDNAMGRVVKVVTPDVIKHTEYIPGGKNKSKSKKTNVEGDEIVITNHKFGGTLNYFNYIK